MENQSKTPPAVPDGQVQTPETNPSNPASNGGESVREEVAHESSGRPPFAIPQPMREEQVQNAVKFLSHPRVKGSPVIYRRSFLERKGLTKEEIDEAFRRVPDSTPSNAASAEATTTNQTNYVSQPGSSKAPIQTLQPAAGGASTATILQPSRFHWKHALVAIGALAASGAGTAVIFKKMLLPGLKSWVRKVVEEDKESKEVDKESKEVDKLKTSLAEETVEAAKATASAAAIMAKASQELVNAKTEERKRHELLMELMDMQVKEMKSMSKTIHGLETRKKSGRQEDKLMGDYSTRNGTTNNSWMNSQDYTDATFSSVFPKQGNGTLDVDSGAVRPTSAPASVEPLAPPPHPKSYMEIMSMIQRGEKPPGIKEINDMPPNPNQPPSKPVLAPRPKPWEIPQQTQQAPIYGHQYQSDNDPAISEVQDNSQPSQHNGKMHYASEPPFWGKKTVKITEIESEADGARKSSSLPPQRTWIPPQPPAVVMPEAAAAIRQPRSSAQKQLATNDDDVSIASSEGVENETLKYPSSASMDLNQSEIQEESVNTVEV